MHKQTSLNAMELIKITKSREIWEEKERVGRREREREREREIATDWQLHFIHSGSGQCMCIASDNHVPLSVERMNECVGGRKGGYCAT